MSRALRLVTSVFGALLVAAGVIAYIATRERRTLRLRRYRVHIPGMPEALNGLRAAFLSDFHLNGPGFGNSLTQIALELVDHERPDLVLLGGDYCDRGRWDAKAEIFDQVARLDRVIGVLGNHDFTRRGVGAARITEELERRGVRMLRNDAQRVCLRGHEVVIAGVDDPYTSRDDLSAALREGWPLFLLAHAPSVVDRLPIGGAGLVLSGHTHGGQIRTSPFDTLTPLDSTWYLDKLAERPAQRYIRGFHRVRGNLLFVGNGIGTTRWPLRVFSPPEIVILELTATSPHPDEPCDSVERYIGDLDVTSH